jgi:PAS domain S-box-containing protein
VGTLKVLEQAVRTANTLGYTAMGSVHCTKDGVLLDADSKALDLYGYTREEFLSLNARELIHPSEFENQDIDRIHMKMHGHFACNERLCLNKKGETFRARYIARELPDGTVRSVIYEIVPGEAPFNFEEMEAIYAATSLESQLEARIFDAERVRKVMTHMAEQYNKLLDQIELIEGAMMRKDKVLSLEESLEAIMGYEWEDITVSVPKHFSAYS